MLLMLEEMLLLEMLDLMAMLNNNGNVGYVVNDEQHRQH